MVVVQAVCCRLSGKPWQLQHLALRQFSQIVVVCRAERRSGCRDCCCPRRSGAGRPLASLRAACCCSCLRLVSREESRSHGRCRRPHDPFIIYPSFTSKAMFIVLPISPATAVCLQNAVVESLLRPKYLCLDMWQSL